MTDLPHSQFEAPPPLLAPFARHARWLLAVYWPILTILTHWPELDLGPQFIDELRPDLMLHGPCFVLLTLLLIYARLPGRDQPLHAAANLGAGIAGVWAYVDELTQQFVRRTVDSTDIVGNLTAVVIAYAAVRITHRPTHRTPVVPQIMRLTIALFLPIATYIALSPDAISVGWMRRVAMPIVGSVRMDRAGHFGLAIAVTIVAYLAAPLGAPRRMPNLALAAVVSALVAPTLEFAQRLSGRGLDMTDAAAHMVGLALGLSLIILAFGIRHLYELFHPTINREGYEQPDAPHTPAHVNFGRDAAPHEGPSEPNESDPDDTFVGHAALIAVLTFVSRITGLIRDAVIMSAFGLGAVSDAFYIGFKIPNLFRRLFGEGALAAAFIPIYTETLQADPARARRLATACLSLQLVGLGLLTLLGELLLAWMLSQPGWSEDSALAIRLTMIMLPYMPLVCLVAVLGAVLQVRRRFGAPAAAPIVLNLVVIAVTWLATLNVTHEAGLRIVARIVAGSVVLAGLIQLIWLAAVYLRIDGLSFRLQGTAKPLRAVVFTMLPMLVGLAVFQINALADSLIAMTLSPKAGVEHLDWFGRTIEFPIKDQGAVAALELAQRLYQFPLGVFGVAIATAIFPALSAAASKPQGRNHAALQSIFQRGLRLTFFIGLPASAGLILIRIPLVRLLFEHQRFTSEDAQRVAFILIGYASAVWAYSLTHVITRAYYAVKDVRTPLLVSVFMVLANITLNLTLVWRLGVAALAWSTAITASAQSIVLIVLIRKHIAQPIGPDVIRSWSRTFLLTAAMSPVLISLALPFDATAMSKGNVALLLAGQVTFGGLIMILGAKLLKMDELKWLLKRRAT